MAKFTERLGQFKRVDSVVPHTVARRLDYQDPHRYKTARPFYPFSRATTSVCQPNHRFNERNTWLGIQRKYQTRWYS